MNKIILKGRLVANPELKQTQSNISTCNFKVAVDKYSKDNNASADFIDCNAWRGAAEIICKYFSKGKEILVEGSLHNNNYTKADGTKVYGYVVTAEKIEFCGSKSDSVGGGGASQTGNFTPQNVGDFEGIISDGEVPF